MMNVDLGKEGRFASSRTKPYKYSVDSWKRWCDINDCELFVLTEEIVDHDQILSIDADTIVHPECPNVFEMTDNKFTVVEFDGSWDWVLRSIESYSKYVFSDYKLKEWWKYFDSGFWIVNKSHKSFAKKFVEFYNKNSR